MKYFLSVFIFCSVAIHAQQLPHMSQWANHQFAINPAHTGIKTCLEAQGTFRGQWIKLDGAPLTGWVGVSAPLKAKRTKFLSARHGLGALAIVDKIGPFQQFSAQVSYAGHFNFSQTTRLSLGLSAGFTQLSFDKEAAKPLTSDPAINGSASQLFPTTTFGAWWNGKNYFAGLALYNLIPQKRNEIGSDGKSRIHGMVNAGFRWTFNPELAVVPGIYVGFTAAATPDIQLQAIADYRRKFLFGAGIRNTDAVIAFLGLRFDEKWRVMYSYDFILSSLRPNTFHSHELTLSFSPCRIPTSDQQLCPLFE